MTRTIEIDTHPGQWEVHRSRARFKVLACGRRWGKTRLGVNECLTAAGKRGRAWWVAPTYKMSEVGWRPLRRIAAQAGCTIRKADRTVEFPNGGEIAVRSADNPDSLRGEGLDLVVVDECAFVQEDAWNEALRPALSDRQGKAIFISTPKGRNWFFRAFQRGITGVEDWAAWQFPTHANPHIHPDEIEAARASLPDRVFRQEYLAEFLENEGAVFRNIGACIHAPQTSPEAHAGHRLVMGVDWGKHNDYTVMSVLCTDCAEEVAIDRTNRIDYAFQRQRLAGLVQSWQVGQVLAESNAMGEPIIEQLQRAGLPVEGFQTTAVSKPPLIESLVLAFERVECQWLPDPIATSELEAFEQKITATGRSTYSAPEGLHDDTVIARCLAWRAATSAPWLLM